MRYIAIAGLLLLMACGKDHSGIPDVAVNFRANLSDPRMSALNNNGGSVMLDNYGVAGLIIYRGAFDGQYKAYDRCSTVNPEQRCAVVVDNTSLTATDPCSKGVFSLEDGTPQKAPAKRPLKQYSVSVTPGGMISVFN